MKALIHRDSSRMALCREKSLSMARNMVDCFDSKSSYKIYIHTFEKGT